MRRIEICVLLWVLAFVAAGCATEYKYDPPNSEDGRRCVQQCQLIQSQCRDSQFQKASAARQQCESATADKTAQCKTVANVEYDRCKQESWAEYNACLKYSDKRKDCRQKQCQKKGCSETQCYLLPDYEFCESDFRLCYQNCGGKVSVVE